MQNLECAASPPSSLFQLWITQWQLGILDPRDATFVLKTVLVDLRTREGDDPFWKFLAQFFASPVNPGTSFPVGGAEPEQLLQRAETLQSQQAKLLLEYLGRCYAFRGDDLQFWTMIRETIQLLTDTPCEKSRPDSC